MVEGGHAVLVWDSAARSEWGPVGVNVDMYELQYAEYGTEYDERNTVHSTEPWAVIAEELDSTKYYKARCRARSHHRCDIHDTLVWGPWSADGYFYVGTQYPDTVPLACGAVGDFRVDGERGGRPHFSWERCTGHTEYEVEYGLDRAAWSREKVRRQQWTLPEGVEPGMEYRVRVRAKCEHRCYIHDTVMWSAWSEILRVTAPGERMGAETAEGEGLFELVPNPARGEVIVRLNAGAERLPAVLTLTDMQGREVRRVELRDAGAGRVDLTGLAAGTYVATLTCNDKTTSRQRLVVE